MKRFVHILAVLVALLAPTSVAWAEDDPHPAAPAPGEPHLGMPQLGDAPKADAPKAEEPKADAKAKEHAKEKDDEDDGPHHAPVKMTIGVHVTGLNKFDLAQGTFAAEFIVSVKCDHEPCKGDLELSNGKITGKEKLVSEKLHKVFKMKADLAGEADLSEYPFDEHSLAIIFEDKEDPENSKIELDKQHTSIDPDIKLPGWNITGWDSKKDKDEVGEGGKAIDQLVYEIDIKRPGPASFFKSIFPVACMILVAGMTLLLKPKSAAGRLTAATGALLTIVAFHISSTGSLPPLGYLTRMDKFMVGNYFIYLVNIGFAVGIVRADEAKNEALAAKLYNVAQIAVLATAAVVWGLVWGAKI